jgi:hypothetical protein
MKKVLLSLLVATSLTALFGSCSNKVTGTGTKEISVGVIPFIGTISYGDSVRFYAIVYNTGNRAVTWYVNNDSAGNDSLGHIIAINDTSARYEAPPIFAPVTFDSVVIKAVSQQDTTKSGKATAIILSASIIFVDSALGDDQTGKGSIFHPYRTITKALSNGIVKDGDTVSIKPGTYGEGEVFPLRVPHEVTVRGYGQDFTRIAAPTGTDYGSAAFSISANYATIKNLAIIGQNQSGVGIYTSGSPTDTITYITIEDCLIQGCYIGVAVASISENLEIRDSRFHDCLYGVLAAPSGFAKLVRSQISNCDSAGIYVDSASVQLTDNLISDCYNAVNVAAYGSATCFSDTFENSITAGVMIESNGYANLGQDTISGLQGNNVFRDFTGGSRCIYNGSANTIYAVYNTWPVADSATIDTLYIYDNDENAASGAVLFTPVHP